MVLRGVKNVWFEFGLILLMSGPDLPGDWASFLWLESNGICALSSCIFLALFMCISTNALLQMVNHQNSWNSLVINHITRFGVYFSGFHVSVDG